MTCRIWGRLVIAIGILASATQAVGSMGTASGRVTYIGVISASHEAEIVVENYIQGPGTSCNSYERFAVDLDVASGRDVLTLATGAYLSGRQVWVGGTGGCLGKSSQDGEAVSSFWANP